MPSSSTSIRQRYGTHARILGGLVVALSMISGMALADGPPRKASAQDHRIHGLGLRLDQQRLSPRVSLQMESLSAFGSAEPGRGLNDHVMFNQMTETVRRRAKSVTRRVIRDRLLRLMRLDRGIDNVRNSIRKDKPNDGVQSERRNVDFDFGVHSMLPEVGMRYKLRSGSAMGMSLGASGDVSFSFRAGRANRANFSAGFSGDDAFRVGANFSF